jgi:hypothetical protein
VEPSGQVLAWLAQGLARQATRWTPEAQVVVICTLAGAAVVLVLVLLVLLARLLGADWK